MTELSLLLGVTFITGVLIGRLFTTLQYYNLAKKYTYKPNKPNENK